MDMSEFPLIPPRYTFKASLIAGTTPAAEGGQYDYFIDRPSGMKGYILHLTVQGQGQIINNGKEFFCSPGDLVLFPPGIPHLYGRASGCKAWIHQWVYFHPRVYWKDLLEWDDICQGIRYYRPTENNIQNYSNLFLEILSAGKSHLAHRQLLALNLLEQILLRRVDETWNKTDKIIDERVSSVCMYLTENLIDSSLCAIDRVASHVNLSRSRILHLFRQQMGVSIFQWRDEQRMIMARRLLRETALPVSSVAEKVGFEDQLYFSKVFRKYTGTSPTEYRKEIKKS